MKSEIEQLKAQVEELTKRAEAAEAKILAATPAEAEPSVPEGEGKRNSRFTLIHIQGKEAKPDAEEKKE